MTESSGNLQMRRIPSLRHAWSSKYTSGVFTEAGFMTYRSVVFLSLLLVGACRSAPPLEAPAAPAQEVKGTLNQVMRGILFPNSNVIFDAQDKDPGAPADPNDAAASAHVFYSTYGGWEAVEN